MVRNARSRLILALAVAALLGSGVAGAAWQVEDDKVLDAVKEVHERLGDDGTVTDRLKELNDRMTLVPHKEPTAAMVAEPTGDEALNPMQPSALAVPMEKLCPPGASSPLGQQQHQLCQELVRTELSQYRFSLRMFERAKQNYDRLKQLEDRRRGLGADDYADVQYNSNELLALIALMDNDRDRYRTYMAAYDARIAHIRNQRVALTRNALKGSGALDIPVLALAGAP
ncbi:hypothetical protein [Coralloluteibacterium stylophorae]|uniref:Uncharacterized protein n=2 Tax=Coralloluteibacterium stylophorae TaxID=1776034 RepID=A0AAP2FZU5_9GAMM|nr:hypothetical protein [Coralloluteibacterium stylophorae]MBS7458579.1 hypothetical protein [Coralloluteibacterium stylophorae]